MKIKQQRSMAAKANKKSSGGSTRRAKPVAVKAGASKNPKRRYDCGGKIRK